MALNTEYLISVCAVVRNNQKTIEQYIHQTTQILAEHYQHYEILIIDNHSTDNSPNVVKALQSAVPNVRLVRLSRLYSWETAVTAALDNSIGDFVILMDTEADPPELIPEMMKKAMEGYDIVNVREENERDYSFIDKLLAPIFNRIIQKLLGEKFVLENTHFQLFTRRAVNSITQIRTKRRYLRYFNILVGFNQSFIQRNDYVTTAPNPSARRDYHPNRLEIGIDIIVANSAAPLRFASLLGLIASSLNLLYLVYIFAVALVKTDVVEGWITTSIMPTVMFFMIFVILAILAEYVARILQEAKDEPLYFIEYESNSTTTSYTLYEEEEKVNVV